MNGVIWNGVFSASPTVPTGLDLSIRNWLLHGSTLMRPPSGNAATRFDAGFSSGAPAGLSPAALSAGEDLSGSPAVCAADTSDATGQLAETRSPRSGLIKFGISFAWLRTACEGNSEFDQSGSRGP